MCLNFPPQIVLTTSRYTPSISPLNFHLSPTLHIFEFLILFKLLIFLHSPSVSHTLSHIGHANLTKGNESFTHKGFLVVNGPSVVFSPDEELIDSRCSHIACSRKEWYILIIHACEEMIIDVNILYK
jgi:hypothetical protein